MQGVTWAARTSQVQKKIMLQRWRFRFYAHSFVQYLNKAHDKTREDKFRKKISYTNPGE
jgi:hypothetical protein